MATVLDAIATWAVSNGGTLQWTAARNLFTVLLPVGAPNEACLITETSPTVQGTIGHSGAVETHRVQFLIRADGFDRADTLASTLYGAAMGAGALAFGSPSLTMNPVSGPYSIGADQNGRHRVVFSADVHRSV